MANYAIIPIKAKFRLNVAVINAKTKKEKKTKRKIRMHETFVTFQAYKRNLTHTVNQNENNINLGAKNL